MTTGSFPKLGKSITLNVDGVKDIDVAAMAELFGRVVDIMRRPTGYTQEMSRELGFVWLLGDLGKRRHAVKAQFERTGFADPEEFSKIVSDVLIGFRDWPEVWDDSVKRDDMRDDTRGFTLEDEEWVNGEDYISPEVSC